MNTRDKILKTATHLFVKYGLRSISIDDICNELHISKKTFYLYFEKKDTLVECFLCDLRKKHNTNPVLSEDKNIIDTLLDGIKGLKNSIIKQHLNFLYDLQKYYPEIYARHETDMQNNKIKYTQKILEYGIKQDLFRKEIDVKTMSIFITLKFTQNFNDLCSLSGLSMEKTAHFITEAFFRLVANEKGYNYYIQKKERMKTNNKKKTNL